MHKRIMSIWLPGLPLDRRARMGDPRVDEAFAITADIKNAPRLTHLSEFARTAGLQPGMSVPDARAICADLLTEKSDPAREDMLLRALRRWADRLSPWIALDKPDGLTLDITGCAHLFGGERAMADHAVERFADMQITTRIGIADTKGAAWALARHCGLIAISKPSEAKRDLQSLPIEALNIKPKTAADLRRVGLKTIGQLYAVKSGELARRFGLELTQALSKALGQAPDPVSPMAADPIYAARMNLPEPIGLKDDLLAVLERLTHSVCMRLEKDKTGARQFHLTVRCVDTGDHIVSIGFARPCFDAGKVQRQFERPLDSLNIKFGADWFRLVAETLEPIRERQRIMGQEVDDAIEDLSQVITTLGNRLGFDRVRRFVPRDSHLPDREFSTIEAADCAAISDWPDVERKRPLRVFRPERLSTLESGRPPKRFQWRRQVFVTQSAIGPERLSSEWWAENPDTLKDYWAVETEGGERLWLMTYPASHEPNWFVAGRFL